MELSYFGLKYFYVSCATLKYACQASAEYWLLTGVQLRQDWQKKQQPVNRTCFEEKWQRQITD